MYTYELFETEVGFGFKILQFGGPIIVQGFKPDVDGYEPMDGEEAEAYAKMIMARLEG